MGVLTLSACEIRQHRVMTREDALAAAGFIMLPANNAERQGMLRRLPQHKLVRSVQDDGVRYVYADLLVCDCVYIGSQKAYDEFERHEHQQHFADEQQLATQMYSDPAWKWNVWGPAGSDSGSSSYGSLAGH